MRLVRFLYLQVVSRVRFLRQSCEADELWDRCVLWAFHLAGVIAACCLMPSWTMYILAIVQTACLYQVCLTIWGGSCMREFGFWNRIFMGVTGCLISAAGMTGAELAVCIYRAPPGADIGHMNMDSAALLSSALPPLGWALAAPASLILIHARTLACSLHSKYATYCAALPPPPPDPPKRLRF